MALLTLGADMARSSRVVGKKSAAGTRKAKGRNPGKTRRRTAPSAIRSKRSLASTLGIELKEAREQQAATSEVLEAINRSGFDLDKILQTLVSTAARLCKTGPADIFLLEGDVYRFRAGQDLTEAYREHEKRAEIRAGLGTLVGRVALTKGVVHIVDALEDIEYEDKQAASANNFRSMLGVPLLRDGEPIGVFALARTRVEPFSESQIRLVTTFADQAVIAIENTRLFNETHEALERQTATADILKVIAGSPTDVQPVFDAIAKSARRLLASHTAVVTRVIDDVIHLAASTAEIEAPAHAAQGLLPYPLSSDRIHARVARTGQLAVNTDAPNSDLPREIKEFARTVGWRSMLVVPMLRNGVAIGTIGITRREAGSFDGKTIDLLKIFADQAVIAIENARLFNEVQTKTHELADALTYQKASSNILGVIASSPDKVGPALQAIVESACELCDSYDAGVLLKFGDDLHYSAHHGPIPIDLSKNPISRRWVTGRCVVDKTTLQVSDLLSAEGDDFPEGREHALRQGHRCILAVPLVRESEAIGAIALRRLEPVAFNDKQIGLLQTFADQAVVAIENARLFNETKEALERQTATADILKVIASSPSDVLPVFEVIVGSAKRLLGGFSAAVFRVIDGIAYLEAITPTNPVADAITKNSFPRPVVDFQSFAMAQAGKVVQISDTEALSDDIRNIARARGYRSVLLTPMKAASGVIGMINVTRKEVGTFDPEHVELIKTFADQAVIAIENTRLFNETKEALAQQTATAEVLQVINSSPGNLAPVFEAILEKAHGLCAVTHGSLQLYDGNEFRAVAVHGLSEAFAERLRQGYVPGPKHQSRRLIEGERFVQTPDLAEIDDPISRAAFEHSGIRTALFIPLRKDGNLIGQIVAARRELRLFSQKEIALLENFAAQAVVAMESARLFGELRDRTADLARSVDELTATGDVLKIISRSSVELETVLNTLVETVARLCRADQTHMFRRQGDRYHAVASRGASPEFEEWLSRNPLPTTGRGTATARASAERRTIHIADVLADPGYTWQEGQRLSGYRTVLALPLRRGDREIGLFTLLRTRVAPFTDKEIELATTFADQAVIAIENARLFEELRERQAELRVTFDNMGDGVAMFASDTHLGAWNRNLQEMLDLPDALLTGRPSFAQLFRYLAERGEFGSADLEAELSRTLEDTSREMRYERTRPDGRVIEVRRNPVPDGGFVMIYADITERKHAEEAIRLARDAAEVALRDLQAAQTSLVHAQKMAALGQLTAGIAHEIKNPLNFVNNFAALSSELTDELNDVLKPVALPGKVREEVEDLTGTLKDNLGRVVQHGKRADSIVKNMLLHSREGSGEHRPVEINAIIDESLNLAYHGARAEKQGFNITLERDFDPAAGVVDIYPQEVTRVLLNLISNGFYAASQRAGAAGNRFEPRLKAVTRNLGDRVEVRIHDNGTGIPPDIQEKIFNPFFTTKPAGEGTGLGLSLSHDIVVKQHGGTIEVVTEPGSFTEFIITLPRVMP